MNKKLLSLFMCITFVITCCIGFASDALAAFDNQNPKRKVFLYTAPKYNTYDTYGRKTRDGIKAFKDEFGVKDPFKGTVNELASTLITFNDEYVKTYNFKNIFNYYVLNIISALKEWCGSLLKIWIELPRIT